MAVDIDGVVQGIVNDIIARLEKGDIPWHKPWTGHSVLPVNPVTGRQNQGIINPIILWMVSESKGYDDNRWAGFSQWRKSGNPIKKGEKSTVIFRPITRSYPSEDDSGNKVYIKYVAGWATVRVFNNQQTTSPLPRPEVEAVDPSVGFEKAAALIESLDSALTHGGDRAYYNIKEDRIRMPEPGAFDTVADYWSTNLHEHVHWTGEKDRCNRDGITKFGGFGSPSYAYEELIAEMGSTFMCHHLGIDRPELMDNHAAYIGSWIKRLRDNPDALMQAASEASTAVRFLMKE
jgi:antirestriction protein ArdC